MNLKNIILFFFALLSCNILFAQDFIHFSNGEVLRVKVTEVGTSEIRYKKFDNLNGPDYVVAKSEVQKIQYENGQADVLSNSGAVSSAPAEQPKPAQEAAPSHSLSVNILDLIVMSDFTIQYEWVNKSSKLGIRVPLTLGFFNRNFNIPSTGDILGYNNVLCLGTDLRIFPGRVKKVRYVFGPSVNFAYINVDGGYIGADDKIVYGTDYMLRFFINNGFVAEPNKHFRMGLDVGFGFMTNFKPDEFQMLDQYNRPTMRFNLHMGYKF